MKRRFSVIIATYNREDYLRKALDSVLSQTFIDYEFIVVNDGSTDGTEVLLRSYGEKIKTIRQENQGSEMAYKAGVSQASGEYIAFLDSDDFFLPNALETYDRIIKALNSPPLVISAMKRFYRDQDFPIGNQGTNGDIRVYKYRDYLSKDIAIGLAQSRIVMKKTLFEQVQAGTGVPAARNMNDYRLILRAGTYGPCVIITHPITLAYRHHETQSSKNIAKMCQAVLHLIDLARRRKCSNGDLRLLDTYAYLGGVVIEWSGIAFTVSLHGTALRILIKGWPMLSMAMLRKFMHLFNGQTMPVIIKNPSNEIERVSD